MECVTKDDPSGAVSILRPSPKRDRQDSSCPLWMWLCPPTFNTERTMASLLCGCLCCCWKKFNPWRGIVSKSQSTKYSVSWWSSGRALAIPSLTNCWRYQPAMFFFSPLVCMSLFRTDWYIFVPNLRSRYSSIAARVTLDGTSWVSSGRHRISSSSSSLPLMSCCCCPGMAAMLWHECALAANDGSIVESIICSHKYALMQHQQHRLERIATDSLIGDDDHLENPDFLRHANDDSSKATRKERRASAEISEKVWFPLFSTRTNLYETYWSISSL